MEADLLLIFSKVLRSEVIHQRRTDNIMVNRKRTKGHTMIYRHYTLKHKIEGTTKPTKNMER